MRTAFFIDGYNLFYGLLAGTPFKWLDLPALLTYITKIQNPASETAQVNYFTSPVLPPLATRGKESAEAQDVYIRALKAKGVTVHLGRHRLNRGSAPRYLDGIPASRSDKVDVWDLEEKETDVNIAISMYRLLSQQQNLEADARIAQIVLVSADTSFLNVSLQRRSLLSSLITGNSVIWAFYRITVSGHLIPSNSSGLAGTV